jgi:ABC-type polysaccharide transport system permease subunit
MECLMTSKTILSDFRTQAALLIAPAFIIYLVFAVYPMINVVGLSFQKWNGLDAQKQFVGFSNYVDIFTKDPVFWGAFRNTVIWTILSSIFPPLIGLMLALGLNQPTGGLLPSCDHCADCGRHNVAVDVRSLFRPVWSGANLLGAAVMDPGLAGKS